MIRSKMANRKGPLTPQRQGKPDQMKQHGERSPGDGEQQGVVGSSRGAKQSMPCHHRARSTIADGRGNRPQPATAKASDTTDIGVNSSRDDSARNRASRPRRNQKLMEGMRNRCISD